ncbi:MAG: hypothetical protein K1X55_00100 [Chitinophagales bacterium]|nr:hypothetical protein [Chitinophagales bacterium]
MNMFKLFTINIFILLSFQTYSQEITTEDLNTFKAEFTSGCMKKEMNIEGFNQENFCTCAYEKIFEEMETSELVKILSAATKSKKKLQDAFLENPEVQEKIENCVAESVESPDGEPSSDYEDAQWVIAEAAFKEECEKAVKKDKKLNKSLDAEEYCSCTFDKIKEQVPLEDFDKGGKKLEDKITNIALECLVEMMKQ